MPSPWEYVVPKASEDSFWKEIYAPLAISGLENVDRKCTDQVHYALEYKNLADRWVTMWSQWDSEINTEGEWQEVEVFDTHIIWWLQVSHQDFVEGIKTEFDLAVDENDVDITCRFVLKDGAGEDIAGTDNEFTVNIADTLNDELENKCATAEVELLTQTRSFPLAFIPTTDATNADNDVVMWSNIMVDKTMDIKFTEPNMNCTYFFKLQIFWDGEYRLWEDAVKLMET
jgi:hypothetical protein